MVNCYGCLTGHFYAEVMKYVDQSITKKEADNFG